MVRIAAVQTVMDYKKTALEDVKARLFRGVRGRRHGGLNPRAVVQHLSIAYASVDQDLTVLP